MAKPKLVYPYPVAIGTFSDGRELRMSIAQEQGRPVDASRAERLLRFAHATNFGPPWSGAGMLPPASSIPMTLAFSGEASPATRPARKSAKTRIDDRVSDLLAACRALLANSSALDPLDTLRAAVAAFEE